MIVSADQTERLSVFISRPGLFVPNLGRRNRTKQKRRGINLCASIKRSAGLRVVQRAATPAREPAPIGVDIIPRAIIPAGIEQMPAATARFTRVVPFFGATAALFIRLFA